jgi:hypothetical protein
MPIFRSIIQSRKLHCVSLTIFGECGVRARLQWLGSVSCYGLRRGVWMFRSILYVVSGVSGAVCVSSLFPSPSVVLYLWVLIFCLIVSWNNVVYVSYWYCSFTYLFYSPAVCLGFMSVYCAPYGLLVCSARPVWMGQLLCQSPAKWRQVVFCQRA